MAYGDLHRNTAFNKLLCNKALNVSKNSKYDDCQRGLASMLYKSFDKKSSDGAVTRAP